MSYIVKKEDLKGNIKNFPIEIVQKMVDYQVEEKGRLDLLELQNNPRVGFTWSKTEEGYDFWYQVINNRDFEVFFKKYPNNISEDDLIGRIKHFPIDIVQRMIDNQINQGNKADVTIFQKNVTAGKDFGGFSWKDTQEGFGYWAEIITNSIRDRMWKEKSQSYKVTEDDLVGDIKNFPLEVVQKMVDEQVRQGNKADVSIFQDDKGCISFGGGFDWSETREDHDFWEEVIDNKNFDLFFEKYPTSRTKSNLHKLIQELKSEASMLGLKLTVKLESK